MRSKGSGEGERGGGEGTVSAKNSAGLATFYILGSSRGEALREDQIKGWRQSVAEEQAVVGMGEGVFGPFGMRDEHCEHLGGVGVGVRVGGGGGGSFAVGGARCSFGAARPSCARASLPCA